MIFEEQLAFTAAFVAVALTFSLRASTAVRKPEARKTWLACGVGAIGLFCLGAVLPLADVDAAVGGSNGYYLIMCISAIVAFSLMAGSVLDEDQQRPHKWWPVALLVLAFSVPFLLTDRGHTSSKFTHDQVGQLSMLLCCAIYFSGLSVICGNLIWRLRKSPMRAFWPIIVGASFVIAAAAAETASMTADHYSLLPPTVIADGYLLFTPLFFPGVIFMAAGIVSFGFRKRIRDRKTRSSTDDLRETLATHEITPPRMDGGNESEDQLMRLWLLVVRLRDAEAAGAAVLSVEQLRHLDQAETLLEKQLILPTRVEMWSAA